MKNNLQKWLFAWNAFKVIQFILFFLLFGCQESTEEKSHAPKTFNSINAQKQFDSKSPIEKWEFTLEIVSSKFINQNQVDEWLVKNSSILFSNAQEVPVDDLKSINYELYNAKPTKPALLFAEFTLKYASSQKDLSLNGYPAATMSNYYQDSKLYDSVNKYNLILKKALPFVDSSRLELIYYTNNANSLKEYGDLFESAVNYNKALDLIQKDDSVTIFTLITNLSSIYYELDYPDKAKFFIDSARSIISFNDWTVEALNHAGLVYSKTKDYSVAKSCFLQAIKKSYTDENLISLAQSYSNYANFNRKIKQYSAAFEYMAKSDSLCKELGVDFGILINRINRAELYYDLNDFEKAAMELKSVKADLSKFSSPKLEIDYYKLSYRINDAVGNSNLANSMYRAYMEKKEAYFGDLPRSILAEWELAAESEKIIKNKAAYNLQQEQQSKEKYIIILIATILLFCSILILFVRNRKHIIEREKTKQDKQRIAFDLELKSKQLVSESLKNLTIQNTKEELLIQLEEIIQDIPKLHHIKFDLLKRRLKQHKSSSILNEFETRFTGVYEQYYESLKNIAPELTPNDLRICALMRLNISTKEIALLTNRTVGTVDNIRSSIRKKLKLDEETNLQEFLLHI
jgi:DNA-binding CsgD family transcriptional regulator